MAEFYEMPAVSPTMEVGTLVEWRVKEGEAFKPQTVMAEVGTDKANMEAEVFDNGVMIKHLIEEGDEVPAGYPIAIIGQAADEDIADLLTAFEARKSELGGGDSAASAAAAEPKADAPKADAPKADAPKAAAPAPTKAPAPPKERQWSGRTLSLNFMDPPGDIQAATVEGRILASPLAKKIAADKGLNLAQIQGSGPGGRIVKDDVLNAKPAAAGASVATRQDTIVRNSPMRKTIAKRLLESHQDIPTFYLTIELDMDAFVDLRTDLKAKLPDVKISYNDMLTLAVARALRESPQVNASWGDKAITQNGSVDIGIAVALPDGLITPVVRNADNKSLSEIAGEIRDLAGKAKNGKLAPEQYSDNTFTISNLGMFGIQEFTAIINPPASAILAVGTLEKRAVFDDDGDLVQSNRMKVTMTCDHRVIDGATGAMFLQAVRKYVESPWLMLV
ncbi:MAG: dihydrolipoamide acetyltransferase family protein [Myxococcota bacterium]